MNKSSNQINLYIHCNKCIKELPAATSPSDFQDIKVGFTEKGIQVWCKRHDQSMLHIDFEGNDHPTVMG